MDACPWGSSLWTLLWCRQSKGVTACPMLWVPPGPALAKRPQKRGVGALLLSEEMRSFHATQTLTYFIVSTWGYTLCGFLWAPRVRTLAAPTHLESWVY